MIKAAIMNLHRAVNSLEAKNQISLRNNSEGLGGDESMQTTAEAEREK